MSARRTESTGPFQQVTVEARQTRLVLSPNSVVIHKNGIEFRGATPFSEWTDMNTTLPALGDLVKIHCSGVVISCTGNKHAGYHVSMVLTGLSKQAQARLSTIACAQLG